MRYVIGFVFAAAGCVQPSDFDRFHVVGTPGAVTVPAADLSPVFAEVDAAEPPDLATVPDIALIPDLTPSPDLFCSTQRFDDGFCP